MKPRKSNVTFSDDAALEYIMALENPHKVGWDSKNRVWRTPKEKGYDKNQIAYGLDIRQDHNPVVYNFLKEKGRLKDPWLTEGEATDLMAQLYADKNGSVNKAVEKMGGNISQRGYNVLRGMAWHGHPMKQLLNPDSITGKAFLRAIANGDRDLNSVFDAYYGYGSNATQFADRIKADARQRGSIIMETLGDGNKRMRFQPVPQWEPQPLPQPIPETQYPLNGSQAPESISSWNAAQSPSATPTIPSIQKLNNERQKAVQGAFQLPEVTVTGNRRTSLLPRIPSLSDVMQAYSPQNQLNRQLAQSLGLDEFQNDLDVMSDLFKFKNGKLPKYDGGKQVIGSNVNMNDDGTFTDDYTRVFDDLVVTPKGPRIKPGQLHKYQEPWDDEKFTNAVTLGGLNNLSPAQWVGRLSDVVSTMNGNMNLSTLSNRWLYGNPGTFSISKPLEKYSEEHPNAANAANMLFDFWTLGGPSILRNARNINIKDTWREIDADHYRMNDYYVPEQLGGHEIDDFFDTLFGSNRTSNISPLKQANKTVEEIKPVNSTNVTNNSNISPVKNLEQDEPLSMIDTPSYRDRRIFRQYEQDLPDIIHMEDEWRNGGYQGSKPRLLPYLQYSNMSSEDAFKLIFGDARVDPETGRKYFMVLPQYKDFVTLRGVSKPWGYSFSGVQPSGAYDKSWASYKDIPDEIKNGGYLIVPDEASLQYALGTAAQPVKNKVIKPKLSKDRVDWSDYKKQLRDKINEDWEQNGPLRSHLQRSGITNPDILMDYMITPEQAWNMSMKDPGLNIGQMLFNSQIEDEIFRNGIFLKSFNQSLNKILKSRGYPGMQINTDNIITKGNVLNQVRHHTNKTNATKKIMSAAFHDVLKRDQDAAKEFYTLVDNKYDNAFASTNKGVMYIPPKTSNFGRTVSHEMGHLEDMNVFGDDPVYGIVESTQNTITPRSTSDLFKKAFDLSKLDESTAKYFGGVFSNSTEMAQRATQIADYLGLKKGEPITPEKLRYAIDNYIKDTGMDNNMSEFFSTIKDIDAAAKWMSAFHKAVVPGAISTATYKALQPRKKKKQ